MVSSALGREPSIAEALESRRDAVLVAYRSRLDTVGNSLALDADWLDQAVAQAAQILDDVGESLRSGRIRVDERSIDLAWEIGTARARTRVPPADSLRAAMELFELVLEAVLESATGRPEATVAVLTATRTLQRSIMMRIRWASEAYVSFLLDQVHQVQLAERRRIARELHDRVGGSASVVVRNLELTTAYAETSPVRARTKLGVAHRASVQTLDAIRGVATDLRLESKVDNLEKALAGFLDAMANSETTVDVTVSGDESWVPATALDELFLVIREALRNAFDHAAATTVLGHVDIAPHEIRAWVNDDGVGFDPEEVAAAGGASGLASMRERVELLGGKLSLCSVQGRGTRVEALIPLPGVEL
jgi:signal transduction histidine kinase